MKGDWHDDGDGDDRHVVGDDWILVSDGCCCQCMVVVCCYVPPVSVVGMCGWLLQLCCCWLLPARVRRCVTLCVVGWLVLGMVGCWLLLRGAVWYCRWWRVLCVVVCRCWLVGVDGWLVIVFGWC